MKTLDFFFKSLSWEYVMFYLIAYAIFFTRDTSTSPDWRTGSLEKKKKKNYENPCANIYISLYWEN